MSGGPAVAIGVGDALVYGLLAVAGFAVVVVVCAIVLALINLVLPTASQQAEEQANSIPDAGGPPRSAGSDERAPAEVTSDVTRDA
ncbi:MAG: hypothetical protein ABR532_05035 [Candidatus Dormibacteria bacterium]